MIIGVAAGCFVAFMFLGCFIYGLQKRGNKMSEESIAIDVDLRANTISASTQSADKLRRAQNSEPEANLTMALFKGRPSFQRSSDEYEESEASLGQGREVFIIPVTELVLEDHPFARGGGGHIFNGKYQVINTSIELFLAQNKLKH
jgi:hypothetical protein